MSNITKAENEVGAKLPTKKICHVYACGGNSILAGTLQYNTTTGSIGGLTDTQRAKYWDTEHIGVWRLKNSFTSLVNPRNFQMKYVKKEDEPLFIPPESSTDCYSTPMIIFPRLRELYSNTIDIGFCTVYANGCGFKDVDTANFNVNEPDPMYQSKNLTKVLGRHLDLTVRHMKAMGYDVRVKGILMIGQSVADVWKFLDETYDKATFKTDLTAVINYFRNTLGYTNVPFYLTETTQAEAYPTESADWNDAVMELGISLGNVYLHKCHHWLDVSHDDVHPNGTSGILAWGEGSPISGNVNLAQLIYNTENT